MHTHRGACLWLKTYTKSLVTCQPHRQQHAVQQAQENKYWKDVRSGAKNACRTSATRKNTQLRLPYAAPKETHLPRVTLTRPSSAITLSVSSREFGRCSSELVLSLHGASIDRHHDAINNPPKTAAGDRVRISFVFRFSQPRSSTLTRTTKKSGGRRRERPRDLAYLIAQHPLQRAYRLGARRGFLLEVTSRRAGS